MEHATAEEAIRAAIGEVEEADRPKETPQEATDYSHTVMK